jgi:excisionase family DNA binding protein
MKGEMLKAEMGKAEMETTRPLTTDQPCVTRLELPALLRVSIRTVDRMIANGEIPVRRVRGRTVRFLRSDVEEYLKREKLKAETLKAEIGNSTPLPTLPPTPHPACGHLLPIRCGEGIRGGEGASGTGNQPRGKAESGDTNFTK